MYIDKVCMYYSLFCVSVELMIIVEYCRYGSLHEYLLVHREDFVDQVDRDTRELNTALGAEKIHQLQTMKEKKM